VHVGNAVVETEAVEDVLCVAVDVDIGVELKLALTEAAGDLLATLVCVADADALGKNDGLNETEKLGSYLSNRAIPFAVTAEPAVTKPPPR
jgi:hypothetical protein